MYNTLYNLSTMWSTKWYKNVLLVREYFVVSDDNPGVPFPVYPVFLVLMPITDTFFVPHTQIIAFASVFYHLPFLQQAKQHKSIENR
jgi:hypothetical protein